MVNLVNFVGGSEGELPGMIVSYYVLIEKYIYMSNLGRFEVLTVRHSHLRGKCTKFTKFTGGKPGTYAPTRLHGGPPTTGPGGEGVAPSRKETDYQRPKYVT